MTSAARKLIIAEQQSRELNIRILVVEDEPAIAEAYRDILAPPAPSNLVPLKRSSRQTEPVAHVVPVTTPIANEFDLTVVQSARDAILAIETALSENRPYAMGFFDVRLGSGMDGIELVKRIFELDSELVAVFVTAYSDRTVHNIQSLLGRDQTRRWDYINKPFSQGEILQKARNSLALWNLARDKRLRDTELHELQQRLFESERLSSVAAVARGIGHEFGNILTQILGRAELSRGQSESELRETLDQILKASYRASDILDRFKDLAKPSGASVQKQWMFLHQAVDEAIELLGHQLRVNNIKVTRIKTEKVSSYYDRTGVLQVLVNLIINAIHAMPGSGQIDFSVEEIGKFGQIKVRDYGSGVEPQIIERITEPFFTTKGSKGTGLGLAIARDIIEVEHQGELVLSNHPAKGFEVVLRIPLEPEERGSDGSD